MDDFTTRIRTRRGRFKLSILLAFGLALGASGLGMSAYLRAQAWPVSQENRVLKNQPPPALNKISYFEHNIAQWDGLGSTIDQGFDAGVRFVAVHADVRWPSPVHAMHGEDESNDNSFDSVARLDAQRLPPDQRSLLRRLEDLNAKAGKLGSQFATVVAHLEERGATLPTIPSLLPADGVITSPFGSRRNPVTHVWKGHRGIDIAAPYGSPVRATAQGKVKEAQHSRAYGWLVVVDHGNGVHTYYAHNSQLNVERGQEVEKGQTIALVGSSGRSTGCHVHYEVRVDNKPVNPELFLLKQVVRATPLLRSRVGQA